MPGLDPSSTETDRELLDRFAVNNSPEVFRALVARHGSMVYHACLRVVGNPHEAEDAAQAVFIVLFQRPPTAVQSLAGWLHAVARKTALKAIRSRARQAQREKVVAAMRSQSVEMPDGDLGELLDAALSALPAAEREVVILRYLEEEGVEQVARRLGCSISTVSTRASQALSRMAQYFRQRGLSVAAPALAVYLAQQGASASAASAAVSEVVAPVALGPGAWNPPALHLANAVLRSMFWAKAAAWVGATATVLTAVGVVVALAVPIGPPQDEALLLTPTVLAGHKSRVVQLAFSADGARLASIDDKQRLIVWDAATGRQERSLTVAHSDREGSRVTAALALAPDGKTIAETVNKWSSDLDFIDVATGVQRSFYFGDGVSPVRLAFFSPDGRSLATGGRLMLWDVRSGRKLWTGEHGRARSLAFSPDARTMVVAYEVGGVDLLDASTGAVRRALLPTTEQVAAVAVDGPSLLAWTGSKLLKVDLATGAAQASRTRSGTIPGMLGCTGDGLTLLTAGQVVHQPWPLTEAPAAVAALPPRVTAATLCANGQRLAVALADQSIHVYDIAKER